MEPDAQQDAEDCDFAGVGQAIKQECFDMPVAAFQAHGQAAQNNGGNLSEQQAEKDGRDKTYPGEPSVVMNKAVEIELVPDILQQMHDGVRYRASLRRGGGGCGK